MNFLSDNGGETFNLCHCAFHTLAFLPIAHITQSGATLKSPISTFGVVPRILPSSISSNRVAVSTMRSVSHSFPLRLLSLTVSFGSDSVGAMRPYTRSRRRYSEKRTRFTFSVRSGTSIPRTHTVLQRRTFGVKGAVRAIPPRALVRPCPLSSLF